MQNRLSFLFLSNEISDLGSLRQGNSTRETNMVTQRDVG